MKRNTVVGTRGSKVVHAFHRLYYDSLGWDRNYYLGHQVKQCPFDLQVYQELVFKIRPQFLIQTGVAEGGSVLYFANLFDVIGLDSSAVVIGIDIKLSRAVRKLRHPRISLIEGNSTSARTIKAVESRLPTGVLTRGMVSLDSSHSARHVLKELRLYRRYVGVGSYLVVEDTNLNGHPVFPDFGSGPFEAVEEFLREDHHFVRDDEVWRRNLFSFHQDGWLRRVS